MKKLIFYTGLVLLAACGGGGKTTVETKDVKGTIEAPGAESKTGVLVNDEGSFEQAILDYNGYQISISPTKSTFAENWARIEEMNKSFGTTIEEIEKTDNLIFYKENKDFMDKKSTGYMFYVYKKGKNKAYLLKGSGEGLDAIAKKEDAENALKAAKTFEPAD